MSHHHVTSLSLQRGIHPQYTMQPTKQQGWARLISAINSAMTTTTTTNSFLLLLLIVHMIPCLEGEISSNLHSLHLQQSHSCLYFVGQVAFSQLVNQQLPVESSVRISTLRIWVRTNHPQCQLHLTTRAAWASYIWQNMSLSIPQNACNSGNSHLDSVVIISPADISHCEFCQRVLCELK